VHCPAIPVEDDDGNLGPGFGVLFSELECIAEHRQCQIFSVNSHQGFILNGFHDFDYAATL
jgi:hypothetical protein